MILNKKRVFIALLIAIFIIIIYVASSVYNRTFERMDDISLFIPGKDGSENLYGLTDTGKIYSYNYKNRKVDLVLEESDIIFFKIEHKKLIIHRDGSIYIDEDGGFEGKLLGRIEGAVSGDIYDDQQIAIITNTGQLYMYGHNEWGGNEYNVLGTGDKHKLDQLTLMKLPEKIIKVDCGPNHTFLLSDEGTLYVTGMIGTLYSEFTAFNGGYGYTDFQSNYSATIFLKENDKMVKNGPYDRNFFLMDSSELYNKNFVSFSLGKQTALGVTNSGNVYYWGRDVYKPDDINAIVHPTKIKEIKDAKEVYCTWGHAYIIKEDTIICAPLERQNKIVRFINYYNIFAPHYKD